MPQLVRALDSGQWLTSAAELLGYPSVEDFREVCDDEALHGVLQTQYAHLQGQACRNTLAERAAAMAVRYLQRPVVIRRKRELAFATIVWFLAANDHELGTPQPGTDRGGLRGAVTVETLAPWIEARLTESLDPGAAVEPTAEDAMSDQPACETVPLIFVSIAKTAHGEDDEWLRDSAEAVCAALESETYDVRGWVVRVFCPALRDSSWACDQPTDPQVACGRNQRHLRTDADAVVTIGARGGSHGTGREEAQGGPRVPRLYLAVDDAPVTPTLDLERRHGPEPVRAASSDDVRSAIADFIDEWMPVIQSEHDRQGARVLRWQRFRTTLAEAWEDLDDYGRLSVAGDTGLRLATVVEAIGSVDDFAVLSFESVCDLAAALRVPLAEYLGTPSRSLTEAEELELARFGDELGVTHVAVRQIRRAALNDLKAGVTRTMFSTVGDWADYAARKGLL